MWNWNFSVWVGVRSIEIEIFELGSELDKLKFGFWKLGDFKFWNLVCSQIAAYLIPPCVELFLVLCNGLSSSRDFLSPTKMKIFRTWGSFLTVTGSIFFISKCTFRITLNAVLKVLNDITWRRRRKFFLGVFISSIRNFISSS